MKSDPDNDDTNDHDNVQSVKSLMDPELGIETDFTWYTLQALDNTSLTPERFYRKLTRWLLGLGGAPQVISGLIVPRGQREET